RAARALALLGPVDATASETRDMVLARRGDPVDKQRTAFGGAIRLSEPVPVTSWPPKHATRPESDRARAVFPRVPFVRDPSVSVVTRDARFGRTSGSDAARRLIARRAQRIALAVLIDGDRERGHVAEVVGGGGVRVALVGREG